MPTAPTSPTAAPTAPDRTDRSTFSARATAWADYQKVSLVPQMFGLATNAYANAVEAAASATAALASQVAAAASEASAIAYTNATGTSAQSKTIGTGAYTFTDVQAGRGWVAGMGVIAYNSDGNYMRCTVTSYSASTLVLESVQAVGSGTYAAWSFFVQSVHRQPVFSAASVGLNAVSSGEDIGTAKDTGLSTAPAPIFGNSLFVVFPGQWGGANASSSPDGITWTLRALPASRRWNGATNGTNKFIVVDELTTNTAKSTDGTTYSAATALPGTPGAGNGGVPAFVGDICLVLASAASTAYWSNDNAASWTSATLPSTVGAQGLFSVGGVFWYWNATTAAHTSATGATGSWTSRTLPAALTSITQDFDGALILNGRYRSSDGINWTDLGLADAPLRSINGVYMVMTSGANASKTLHNGQWARRSGAQSDATAGYIRCAKNAAGTVFLLGYAGANVIRIAPSEAAASTAFFSR